jgi:hypothetical protein
MSRAVQRKVCVLCRLMRPGNGLNDLREIPRALRYQDDPEVLDLSRGHLRAWTG